MKALFALILFSTVTYAQDPSEYMKNFDAKIYSLKSKGVKEFVVDIESNKLTKQLNDQQVFGKIEELYFRTYWTAAPERIAIEVMGMPEGFKEVKEELKALIMSVLENLFPPTLAQKFTGYKFSKGTSAQLFVAQDTTGIASTPSYNLKFNEQDVLEEITGNRLIGTFSVRPTYAKEGFSDGKLVLKEQVSISTDNGSSVKISRELDYGKVEGVGVLTGLTVTTEQKGSRPEVQTMTTTETLNFKNYKINQGEALKYFLGNENQRPETKPPK